MYALHNAHANDMQFQHLLQVHSIHSMGEVTERLQKLNFDLDFSTLHFLKLQYLHGTKGSSIHFEFDHTSFPCVLGCAFSLDIIILFSLVWSFGHNFSFFSCFLQCNCMTKYIHSKIP